MKTVQTLKHEIQEVLSEIEHQRKINTKEAQSIVKTLKAKLPRLKTCLMYVETEPSVEFIIKEKERLTNRINAFMDNYTSPEDWGSSMKSKHKREYEKEMGIPKLRKQLSTIYFILK